MYNEIILPKLSLQNPLNIMPRWSQYIRRWTLSEKFLSLVRDRCENFSSYLASKDGLLYRFPHPFVKSIVELEQTDPYTYMEGSRECFIIEFLQGRMESYEGQSISNASYFFSPLLFKKTQIQLHSLKTTTLGINLSLFNIISVHFHRFGPPFNKGMYSSPLDSVLWLNSWLQKVKCPFAYMKGWKICMGMQ